MHPFRQRAIRAATALLLAATLAAGGAMTRTSARPLDAPPSQPTSNPAAPLLAALLQRQLDALNRGDVAGVMATFTDDAVLDGPGLCAPTACTGRVTVQREIEREVAGGVRISLAGVQAAPPRITGVATATSPAVRAAGVTRIALTFAAEARGDRIAAMRWAFDRGDAQTAAALAASSAARPAAELVLGDPRPCIPARGEAMCDAARRALWNGDAAAWAARGVTDPDARFNETVVFRVMAGDPAAISAIARLLGAPYLKITRLRFAGTAPDQGDEFIEITNLGGGAQQLVGWTVRSPVRGVAARLPDGVALAPGAACRVWTGSPPDGGCGGASFLARDVWPDDAGEAVLFFDALGLPGDDTRYRADPASQPPPPNLQLRTEDILLP